MVGIKFQKFDFESSIATCSACRVKLERVLNEACRTSVNIIELLKATALTNISPYSLF